MPNPQIDVVIRFKNEEFWLNKLRKKFSKLHGVDIFLHGVDNRSDDRSRLIFDSFDNPNLKEKTYQNIDQYRPGHALNVGANKGNCANIVFLSAHCIPADDDYFVQLLSALDETSPGCAGVFGRQLPLACSGPQNTVDLLLTYPKEDRILRRTPLFNNANSMVRRSIYSKYQFDETVTNLEDLIWAKKLQELGHYIKYTSKASVYHYHGIHQHELHSGNQRVSNSLKVLLDTGWLTIDSPEFCDAKNLVFLYVHKHTDKDNFTRLFFNDSNELTVAPLDEDAVDYDCYDYIIFSSGVLDLDRCKMAINEVSEQTSQISIISSDVSKHNLQQLFNEEQITELISTKQDDLLFVSVNIYNKYGILL